MHGDSKYCDQICRLIWVCWAHMKYCRKCYGPGSYMNEQDHENRPIWVCCAHMKYYRRCSGPGSYMDEQDHENRLIWVFVGRTWSIVGDAVAQAHIWMSKTTRTGWSESAWRTWSTVGDTVAQAHIWMSKTTGTGSYGHLRNIQLLRVFIDLRGHSFYNELIQNINPCHTE